MEDQQQRRPVAKLLQRESSSVLYMGELFETLECSSRIATKSGNSGKIREFFVQSGKVKEKKNLLKNQGIFTLLFYHFRVMMLFILSYACSAMYEVKNLNAQKWFQGSPKTKHLM